MRIRDLKNLLEGLPEEGPVFIDRGDGVHYAHAPNFEFAERIGVRGGLVIHVAALSVFDEVKPVESI